MKWFRWYDGTCEDGKFRMIARNASVTPSNVIALWAVLLEDASNDKHRGVAIRGEDFYSSILDLEDGVCEKMLEEMQGAGLIDVGHGGITITNWNKRQFETDTKDATNAERQRRFREKHHKNEKVTESNGDVTPMKRPEADTETDTEAELAADEIHREEILPTGWQDYAEAKGVPNQQIFSSWTKFKERTKHPFLLSRWKAWIDRERIARAA